MNEHLSNAYRDYLNAAASGCSSVRELKEKIKADRIKIMCLSGYHVIKRSPYLASPSAECAHCKKWFAMFTADERKKVVYE